MERLRRSGALLRRVGPGIAVAATGVGAGDLVAASLAGLAYGEALLWAVAAGAVLKLALNEGIARSQLVRGETLLETLTRRAPAPLVAYLGLYLAVWTPAVAAALAAATGIAAHALLPVLSAPAWGALHAAVGATLVLGGRYGWFERVMKVLVGVMVIAILGAALWLRPDPLAVAAGLAVPSLPAGSGVLLLAVLGGVGGSVTLLAYGYWIAEKGWRGRQSLPMARLDLAIAYSLTGVFGIAMVIVAAGVPDPESVAGDGVLLLVAIGRVIADVLGDAAGGLVLVGVWAAVFSSLVGVWHGVPALLSDFVEGVRRRPQSALGAAPPPTSPLRRGLVVAIALLAALLVQVGRPLWLILTYTVVGSLFMPLLAACLLAVNSRRSLGRDGNGGLVTMALVTALVLFLVLAVRELVGAW